jgi:hypothetical protein
MSNSSPLSEQEKSYFIDQLQNIEEEWNKGNREPYIEFHKYAFYMVPHLETLDGPDVIRDFVEAFPEMKAKYDILDIWGNSDVATGHGKFQGTSTYNELLDKGKYLASFSRDQEGKWKMTHTIWNSDLPLPDRPLWPTADTHQRPITTQLGQMGNFRLCFFISILGLLNV